MRRARMKTANKIKNFVPVVIILAVSLAAEIIFSNFVYLAFVAGRNDVSNYKPLGSFSISMSEENTGFDFQCSNFKLNSVSFTVKTADENSLDSLTTVNFYVFDENSTQGASLARSERIAVGAAERKAKVYLSSLGTASGMIVDFPELSEEITLSDITVNPTYEFSFDFIRFAAVFVLLAVIYILKTGTGKQLCREITYNQAALLSCALSCMAAILFWALCSSSEIGTHIAYPLQAGAEYYQPYIQQFDAFMKGQLHFDVEVGADLLALENPYSPSERDGIYYLFDRAFFEGEYYSYFGIAPILVVYYPFYLLTNALPVDSTVMGVFALLTALFLPLAVIEWAKLLKADMRPWFAAVCAVGAYFASMALLIQRGRTPFYYIASAAGMAFVSAFSFWILKALGSKKPFARIACMVLAGVSFALGFLSRINSVLPAAFVVAAFVIIYFIKSIKAKKFGSFFAEMAALALPVAGAVAFSLYYNFIRFGDILQFGTDYQLTVANASLYEISAGGIFPSLFHYFLQPFEFSAQFPFITFSYLPLSDYGKTVYIDSSFGIFALPFMLSLLLAPVLYKSKKISKNGKALLTVSLLALVITAFADFCLGGVIFRYTADISLPAAMISAVILLEAVSIWQKERSAGAVKLAKKCVLALVGVTICISLSASLMINGNLTAYSPDFYISARDFFVFWS